MQLVLVPSCQNREMKQIYERAFSEATELYILSAYLTEWDFQKLLNPKCNTFRLIVGTDFGITRKRALQKALAWIPKDQKCNFLAVDRISGFHPKVAFWKNNSGAFYCVIGSSNQTSAAFNTNYEANVLLKINLEYFNQAINWVKNIENNCSQINEYWIENYEEIEPSARKKPKHNDIKNVLGAYDFKVPADFKKHLLGRKIQMKTYARIRGEFMSLVEKCAAGQISNSEFYREFTELWQNGHYVSFQSDGWKRTGKDSDLSEICRSLIKVRESEQNNLDDIVKVELDRLEKLKVPTKKSLFTEFLCKELPDHFPVWNKPIERYLRTHQLHFPRSSSFGSQYIHLAREMRRIAKREGLPVKNLAELDLLIGLQQGWN